MSTENTFSDFLESLFRREENLFEFIRILEESYSTDNESVSMQFELADGSTEEIQVGSVSAILRRLKNLENNVEQMANIGNVSNASIVLPDGTLRSVLLSDRVGEPKVFTVGNISSIFERENYMKHLFVDPYVYLKVPLPVTDYPAYNKAKVNKVILTLDTDDKASYFEQNLKNVNLEYSSIDNILANAGIDYKEVDIDIDVSTLEYAKKGLFDVMDIVDKKDITGNSTDEGILYLLNTLFYKDKNTNTDIFLKKNDIVYVDATEYRINYVDEASNHIGVTRLHGYDPITIGVNKLLYLNKTEDPFVPVPINNNEFLIIFIKPINPASKVVNGDWGVGTAVNTDELLNGEIISDLWQSVSAVANESLVSASDFIAPPAPQLISSNFNVVVVNDHKSNSSSVKSIKKKFSEKQEAESNLQMIQEEIVKTNKAISTTDANDNATKNELKSQLETLGSKQVNASKELESKVNELNAVSVELKGYSQKWQIQGYITESAEAFDGNKIIRNIGYDVEYRYLSRDGKTKENEAISLASGTDAQVAISGSSEATKKAVIPKWLKMPNPKIREKSIDGKWLEEDLSSIDAMNITQITIPISSNEIVEIRARAISEAGYPLQMNYSDWSTPLKVEFPLEYESEVETIIELSKTSVVFNRIMQDLAKRGTLRHNEDSVEITEKYYAHFLRNLGTDELTPENKPIDAQTLINTVKSRVLAVENLIGSLKGVISVRLLKEDESVIAEVGRNNTIKYTEEFYKTIVEELTEKKGHVVNKTMYVEITNLSDGDIELLPFVTGLSDDQLVSSYSGYTFNSDEYNNFRKFFASPMVRLDTQIDADFLAHRQLPNSFIENAEFQSKQVKGQILNSRKTDIRLGTNLWEDAVDGNTLPLFTGSSPQTFIWNGTENTGTIAGNGNHTEFCVHINHPDLAQTSFYMQNWTLYYDTTTPTLNTIPKQTYDGVNVFYPPFYHTELMSDKDTITQLAYKNYTAVASGANKSNFPSKAKFSDNDKFLIGKKTCGLYLTLASDGKNFTNETFAGNGITIKADDRLLLPLLASSRLTDYYGAGTTGTGNVGGQTGVTNISYIKTIGIDLVVKESKLELPKTFSFDFQYAIQYEKSSIN